MDNASLQNLVCFGENVYVVSEPFRYSVANEPRNRQPNFKGLDYNRHPGFHSLAWPISGLFARRNGGSGLGSLAMTF